MTKLFQVKIRAYGYKADFNIEANDTAKDIEQAILDKIGQNRVIFKDSMRSFAKDKCWITYEEIVDDKSRSSSLHKEESTRT
jgi:hypothetical protein